MSVGCWRVGCTRLIRIEAPSSAYHLGLLALGTRVNNRKPGGDLLRFYTTPHHAYGGLDGHARSLDCLQPGAGWGAPAPPRLCEAKA